MKMLGFSCKKAIIVNGAARSGQHAIVGWLFTQADKPSLWLNNLSSANTYDARWFGKKNDNSINLLGIGFERPVNKIDRFLKLPRIIVVRDLYNHIASLEKHKTLRFNKKFYRVWEDFILHALWEKRSFSSNCVYVNFTKWFDSYSYREEVFGGINNILGTKYYFSDIGKNLVMGAGGGSSFDKSKFKHNASDMRVNDRYKSSFMREIIKKIPKDLKELNIRYFGDIYDD